MSITPTPEFPGAQPEPKVRYSEPPPAPGPANWFQPLVIGMLVILAVAQGLVFYQLHELNTARGLIENQITLLKESGQKLERRVEVGEERAASNHNSLKGELMVTREKLGMTERDLSRARALAQQLSEEQKHAAAQIGQVGQQVSSLREESTAKIGAVAGEVTSAKTDIATTRKDLEQTKVQLMTAIGDITKANTLIARNHDELLELRRRGERNYLEFDLGKEKQPRRVGDISLLLKKTDPKKQTYTVEVIAEDSRTEKKDKVAYEPVQFYMGRTRNLYELVVNKIDKDRIKGYLATPK
jgi:chromosome segregation ATPase